MVLLLLLLKPTLPCVLPLLLEGGDFRLAARLSCADRVLCTLTDCLHLMLPSTA